MGRSGSTLPATSASGRILDRRGSDLPSLVEIEQEVMKLQVLADGYMESFAEISEFESGAAVRWENHRDRVYFLIHEGHEWKNESLSQARAKHETCVVTGVAGDELYATWRTLKGSLDTCSKNMTTVSTRLSVQQSLLKHLRQITGLE